MSEIWGWTAFFERLATFLLEAERLDGNANEQYAEYVVERLQLAYRNLTRILGHLNSSLRIQNSASLRPYIVLITELIEVIKNLSEHWQRYVSQLQVREVRYHPQVVRRLSPGRPSFEITQDRLEYLLSLSFTWTEISRILGVSRMTIYRRRLTFGMIDIEIGRPLNDQELYDYITRLRRELPQLGESMVFGRIRSEGYRVSRQRIRQAIRNTDPLNTALRWRGEEAFRRPYSVPGPNALWHIGMYLPIFICIVLITINLYCRWTSQIG